MIKICYDGKLGLQLLRYDAPLTKESKCVCKLMECDYIELSFQVPAEDVVTFHIGDYVDLSDAQYDNLRLYPVTRKKYVVTTKQVPTYNAATGGFQYTLRLDAYYWAWNNRVFKYKPDGYGQEATWGLTGKVSEFLDIFINNLEAIGQRNITYTIDEEIGNYNVNLSFQNTKMIDALKMIADKVAEEYNTDCEWYINKGRQGDIIVIGRCEDTLPTIDKPTFTRFGDNPNAQDIIAESADVEYANRLIVFGGTKNVSPRYRKDLFFQVDRIERDDENNIVIIDNTHTDLNVGWFKTNEQEYKEKHEYNAEIPIDDNGCLTDGFSTGNYTTQTIGTLQGQSSHYVFDFGIHVDVEYTALESSYVVNRRPNNTAIDTVDEDYRCPLYHALFELCLQCSGHDEIIVVSQEVTYDKNDARTSIPFYFNGTLHAPIRTDLPGNVWNVVLRVSQIYYYNNQEWQQPSGTTLYMTSRPINITSKYVGITAVPDGTYRVQTHITMADGMTFRPYLNYKYHDLSKPEARYLTIANDDDATSIQVGDKFVFDNIIKGRVTAGYFTNGQNDSTVNSVVQRNLMLPESFNWNGQTYEKKNYIDVKLNLRSEEIVERVVTFENIYPQMEAAVDAVAFYTHDTEDEDAALHGTSIKGGELVRTHYYWQFLDQDFDFTEDCTLPGIELGVHFVTGALAGLDFKVAWRPNRDAFREQSKCQQYIGDENHRWEIVANEDYGVELPNDILHPEAGDEYILTGWNIETMEDKASLITQAEEVLLNEAKAAVAELAKDPHTYTTTVMTEFLFENTILDTPRWRDFPIALGSKHTIQDPFLISSESNHKRDTRVIGYEFHLDNPQDSPIIYQGERFQKSNTRTMRRNVSGMVAERIKAIPFINKTI